MHPKCRCYCAIATILCAARGLAQTSRITQPADGTRRTILAGHLPPRAQAADDQGRVAPSLPIPYVTLILALSGSQQNELNKLLAAQSTKDSASYHEWLTPEEYAQRFGVSDADIGKITHWLEGQGLKVFSVARARNW